MEQESNTPIGTGYSEDQAALAISSILDGKTGSSDEAVVETETELPVTNSDLHETVEEEQPEVDSDTTEIEYESDGDTSDENAEDKTAPSIDDTYEIELDGQKVSIGELKKGHLRQADYSRKTQELSRKTQELEADKASFGAALAQRNLATLKQFKQQIAFDLAMQTPDWEKLYAEDPIGFAEEKRKAEHREQLANAYWSQISAAEKQEQEKVEADRARRTQQEDEEFAQNVTNSRQHLTDKFDEFRDTARGEARLTNMIGMLQNAGFSNEEISSVHDGRTLEMIYYANLWLEHEAKQATLKQGVVKAKAAIAPQVKPVTPKPTNNAGRPSGLSIAKKEFAARPSDTDAAAALISHIISKS